MDAGENSGNDARPPANGCRIAVSIFKYSPYGGIQRDMLDAVQSLSAKGFEVTVFCSKWDHPVRPSAIKIRELKLSGFGRYGRIKRFNRKLSRILEREKFDRHIAFSKTPGADWYFASGTPLSDIAADLNFFSRWLPRYRYYINMEKKIFSPASETRIMFFSEAQKNLFRKAYRTPESRCAVMPPGISPHFKDALEKREERRKVIRDELGVDDCDVVLMAIGSAFRSKGVDRVIAALAALPENERKRAKLLVVGHDDPAPFRELAIKLGVNEQLRFTGGREDIPELLSAADLLLHPARSEVNGTVLLEALACGTPIVCSGNCGYADFVAEAGGKVLPIPFRQKAFNRALMFILSAPGGLEELQNATEYSGLQKRFFREGPVIADILERSFSGV